MAGSSKKKSFRNVSEKSSRAPALAVRPDVLKTQVQNWFRKIEQGSRPGREARRDGGSKGVSGEEAPCRATFQ